MDERRKYNKWLRAFGSMDDRWINLSFYDTLKTIKPGFNSDYETSGMGDYTTTIGMTEEELLEMPRLPGWCDAVYRMVVTHGGDHGFWTDEERTLLLTVPLDQLEMILEHEEYCSFDYHDIAMIDGEMSLKLDLWDIKSSKQYPVSLRKKLLLRDYEQNEYNIDVFQELGVYQKGEV